MSGRFWLLIGIILVIFGGVLVFHKNNKANGNGTPTSHIEGQGSSGVTLVEYGDYECPFCEQYFPVVKQVAAMYNSEIHFQFRNLPLTQIHPNAFAGARAAEAASLQGQFWQMHDLLYENQNSWVNGSNPQTYFDQYAKSLNLNVSKFDSDYASNMVNDSIQADITAFGKTGQEEATPTFFIDGKHVTPTDTVTSFEQLLNTAIQQKTGKAPNISQ